MNPGSLPLKLSQSTSLYRRSSLASGRPCSRIESGRFGIEAAAVLAQGFLVGDVDIEDAGLVEDGGGEVAEGRGVAAVFGPPAELDDGRHILGVAFVPELFVVFEGDALDQEVPLVLMEKVAVGVRMDPRLVHDLLQDGVLLEPGPEHRKIVDLLEGADVEMAQTFRDRGFLQIIDDFRFARGGAADEDDDLEAVRLGFHAHPT